jgi:hypothetical protein
VRDIVNAFAQNPRLPKMLNRKRIFETLSHSCRDGLIVLRLPRPEGTFQTFWRAEPDPTILEDSKLEVVLPENAVLTKLQTTLLVPDVLPDLWKERRTTIGQLRNYFSGTHLVNIEKDTYTEQMTTPQCESNALESAVLEAVKEGKVWFVTQTAGFLAEDVPEGLLADDVELLSPPPGIKPMDILEPNLPEAWEQETTTAKAIHEALSSKVGRPLPWKRTMDTISGALKNNILAICANSGVWPCDFAQAGTVKFQLPETKSARGTGSLVVPQNKPHLPSEGKTTEANLEGDQLQTLADQIAELLKIGAEANLPIRFYLRIEIGGNKQPDAQTLERINQLLAEVSDDLQFD